MRRQLNLQRAITAVLFILWTLLYIMIQGYIKAKYFTGIDVTDVEYITTIKQATYIVTSIKQTVSTDGNTAYRITLQDKKVVDITNEMEEEIAPQCTIDMTTIPTELVIGGEYPAQWLRVVGVYGIYSRTKDSIAMQLNQNHVDNSTIQKLKQDVSNVLVNDLSGVMRKYYWAELLFSLIIYLIGAYIVYTFGQMLAKKLFVPTNDDYADHAVQQKQLQVQKRRKPIKNHSEINSLHSNELPQINVPVKRTIVRKQIGCSGTDTGTYNVEQQLKEQAQQMQKRMVKHKMQPVQQDIKVDVDKIKK